MSVRDFLVVALAALLAAAQPASAGVATSPTPGSPRQSPFAMGESGEDFVVTRYTSEEGLPQNTIKAITQDRNGAIWVATLAGLARFDGLQFVAFDHENTPVFSKDAFNALVVDRVDGRLWIGGGDGLYTYSRRQFEKVAPERHWNGVFRLWPAADGGVWFDPGTGELGRVRGTNVFIHRFDPGDPPVTICSVDDNGSREVRVAASNGLFTCDRTARILSRPAASGWGQVQSVVMESITNVWVGTTHGLFQWVNGACTSPAVLQGKADISADHLTQVRNGALWACVKAQGICRMRNGSLILLNLPGLTPLDDVDCLYEDSERTVWVGTARGLVSLRPRHLKVITRDDGLVDDDAKGVHEAIDGTIYVATDRGITSFHDGEVTPQSMPHEPHNYRANGVWTDSRGRLYVNALGWHLWTNGVLLDPIVKNPNRSTFPSILEDRSGDLWFGGLGTLFRGREGHYDEFRCRPEAENQWEVKIIHQDRAGALWLGTYGSGLKRFADGKFTSFRAEGGELDNRMWSIHEDSDGVFWIGSENGLHRFEHGKFFSFHADHGLPERDSTVNHVLEDDDGFLWISGLKGIYRIPKTSLNAVAAGRRARVDYLALGQADGMLSAESNGENGNSACKSKDGRLWFPMYRGGVVVFDPRAFLAPESPPPVVIEEIRVDNHVILGDGVPFPALDVKEPPAIRRGPAVESVGVRFAPGKANVIEVNYTANSFLGASKARFRYRLKGQGTNWFEMGGARRAVLPGLRPGNYRFEVTGCNSHGVWQPVLAGFSFSIAPHFYQTSIFYLLCGAAVVGAGVLIQAWRLRVQRRISDLERVAALERERSRIASDLHDELGSGLAQVILLSEAAHGQAPAPRLPQDVARDMMQKLDGIVWSLNPARAEVGSVVDYLAGMAEQFVSATSLQLRLDLPREQPARALEASQRHQLLLALKEMLRNAVVHSRGRMITLRIAISGENMEVSVHDDGVGFDPARRRADRNGLSNLECRATNLGGTFELNTAPGEGTTVSIRFPLIHVGSRVA